MPSFIKELMLKEYIEGFRDSKGFILLNFEGLTVDETVKFRKDLHKENIKYFILKNRVAKIALKELKIEGMDDYFKNATGAVIVKNDILKAAKIISENKKNINNLKIKCGYLEGQFLNDKDVIEIANIPSKEALISKLLMLMNSPISRFVGVLNGIIRNFVVVLGEIEKKKK